MPDSHQTGALTSIDSVLVRRKKQAEDSTIGRYHAAAETNRSLFPNIAKKRCGTTKEPGVVAVI